MKTLLTSTTLVAASTVSLAQAITEPEDINWSGPVTSDFDQLLDGSYRVVVSTPQPQGSSYFAPAAGWVNGSYGNPNGLALDGGTNSTAFTNIDWTKINLSAHYTSATAGGGSAHGSITCGVAILSGDHLNIAKLGGTIEAVSASTCSTYAAAVGIGFINRITIKEIASTALILAEGTSANTDATALLFTSDTNSLGVMNGTLRARTQGSGTAQAIGYALKALWSEIKVFDLSNTIIGGHLYADSAQGKAYGINNVSWTGEYKFTGGASIETVQGTNRELGTAIAQSSIAAMPYTPARAAQDISLNVVSGMQAVTMKGNFVAENGAKALNFKSGNYEIASDFWNVSAVNFTQVGAVPTRVTVIDGSNIGKTASDTGSLTLNFTVADANATPMLRFDEGSQMNIASIRVNITSALADQLDTNLYQVITGDLASWVAGTPVNVYVDGKLDSTITSSIIHDGLVIGTGTNVLNPDFIPEPSTAGLGMLALAGLMSRRRRKAS